MTFKKTISDLNTDAQHREHIRKQEKLDYHHKIYIRLCNCLFYILITIVVLSITIWGAYAFKCPYVSNKAIDLLIEAWKYIGSYIVGGISVKYGLKKSNE